MLVITGPPGSGKSHEILEQLRVALCRGGNDLRLLVPTAAMAAHLRNQMAREGFVLRPGIIQTLAKFIGPWTRSFPEISVGSLEVALRQALQNCRPAAFGRVAELPGFRAALTALVEEFDSAGYDSRHLAKALQKQVPGAPLAGAFLAVFEELERELDRRGWALRAARLRFAADEIRLRGLPRIHRLLLDGFFTLGAPELNLIEAMRRHADLTVVLPEWKGAEQAREALAGFGFIERRMPRAVLRQPRPVVVVAQTMEQEAEDLARRILEQVAQGRSFRDIGIVLRSREPYLPLLRGVLERFGIPARFYFSEPLAHQPAVRLMTGAVQAMRGGWDHAATLELLRMGVSGFGNSDVCDRFDFQVRERQPASGLEGLRPLSDDPRLGALLDRLAAINSWEAARETPEVWAARTRALRRLVQAPLLDTCADGEDAFLWRSEAASLEAFEAVVEDAAATLRVAEPVPLAEFWEAVSIVLRQTPFRPPDFRRNVVHVMDVYEARHWELPVVFVCGLLEKHFPRYHADNPVFPDSARASLRNAGLRLTTLAERQAEEEFLFEVATTRASAELVLSFPESSPRGEPNLRSFFLERFSLEPVRARSARPEPPARLGPSRPDAYLRDPGLLAWIRGKHAVLRPTAIEQFLQCPFRFFLAHTLGLEDPPPRPGDRLGPRLQGEIVHQVLAERQRSPERLETLFERAFESVCARERVQLGCKTELARLLMLRDLKACLENVPHLAGWRSFTEADLEFWLPGDVEVRARVDRFDVSPDGEVAVFDYKYSDPEGVRRKLRGHEEGKAVQCALYLLGLRQLYGYSPAGMFYLGLRGEVTLAGWHTGLPGISSSAGGCTRQFLIEQVEAARSAVIRAAEEIRAGRCEPWPENCDRCDYCGYQDLCRVSPEAADE